MLECGVTFPIYNRLGHHSKHGSLKTGRDKEGMSRYRGQSRASSAASISDGRAGGGAGGGGCREPRVKKAEKPGDDGGLLAAERAGRMRGLVHWT